MECACVDVYVEDFATALANEQRTARKEHQCSECKRTIPVGEKYEYYKGLFEGDIFTEKTCADC